MEAITRLVSESLARHGFDRPLDYRRLIWSRWFRCESTRSLLFVPSKPGVFALAEEIIPTSSDVGADALVRPAERSSGNAPELGFSTSTSPAVEELRFSAAYRPSIENAASAAEGRRMLAVTQFFEDDDMAYVLDRMLTRQHSRLASGRYFVRFVVIEDQLQRRSICNALNQWIANSAERASGIGSHFASSLELAPATEFAINGQTSLFENSDAIGNAHVGTAALGCPAERSSAASTGLRTVSTIATAPQPASGAAANIQRPSPFPAGF